MLSRYDNLFLLYIEVVIFSMNITAPKIDIELGTASFSSLLRVFNSWG